MYLHRNKKKKETGKGAQQCCRIIRGHRNCSMVTTLSNCVHTSAGLKIILFHFGSTIQIRLVYHSWWKNLVENAEIRSADSASSFMTVFPVQRVCVTSTWRYRIGPIGQGEEAVLLVHRLMSVH